VVVPGILLSLLPVQGSWQKEDQASNRRLYNLPEGDAGGFPFFANNDKGCHIRCIGMYQLWGKLHPLKRETAALILVGSQQA
jgi:hypothetical protein